MQILSININNMKYFEHFYHAKKIFYIFRKKNIYYATENIF